MRIAITKQTHFMLSVIMKITLNIKFVPLVVKT